MSTRHDAQSFRYRLTGCFAACALALTLAATGLMSPIAAFGQEEQSNSQSTPDPTAPTAPDPAAGTTIARGAAEAAAAGTAIAADDFPPPPPTWQPEARERMHRPPGSRDEPLPQALAEFYPEKARQLKALRDRDPRKFAQIERQWRPWLRELREARAQNPQLAEKMVQQHHNEVAIRQWQARYQAADESQRPALLEEGRKLAEARVELALERNRLRIQMFEQRLRELNANLRERESHKARAVERELRNMTNRAGAESSQPSP